MSGAMRDKSAWAILAALLLILCIRLIIVEPITGGAFATTIDLPKLSAGTSLFYGSPAEIFLFASLTVVLAGAAVMVCGSIKRSQWLILAAIVILLFVAAISAVGAANRFVAILGVCDLGMAFLGGWTAMLLCNTDARRQLVIVVLVGILAAFAADGLYQRFVTLPATITMFNQNNMAQHGSQEWSPGGTDIALFESRLNSLAVFGFLTLSDIFAAALLPLLLVGLALGVLSLTSLRRQSRNDEKNRAVDGSRKIKSIETQDSNPTSPELVLIPALTVLLVFVVGLLVMVLTLSKGAVLIMALSMAVLIAGWRFRGWLANNRWKIISLALAGGFCIAAAAIGYGLSHHTLPTKDLAFRWQYWTGAAGMITDHPVLGVGMNNFGYYYTQYKPLGAPEDVKDPHNMFIHIAAEAGLPAAILFAGLVLAFFMGAVKRDYSDLTVATLTSPALLAAFVILWWGPKLVMDTIAGFANGAGLLNDTECILCIGAALLAMFAANRAWAILNPPARRCVCLAAILGAAGIAIYDQINIAAVVGPTAMLFWVVLGSFQARSQTPPVIESREKKFADHLAASGLVLAGILLGLLVFAPVAMGTFSLDPAPYIERYQQALKEKQAVAALDAVNKILQRDPRSQEWLMKRIQVEVVLGQNPRQDVLRILDINRTDADIRLALVQSSLSGLTPAERIAQLKLALKLNAALPKDEIQRLSDQQIAQIQDLIQQLQR
ncbi:MAG TPA: O-antigen ligase family protein [Phycisphaerae bacterium]|nr:O-antigen ligase family protein [Phycisphaerae bacterium]